MYGRAESNDQERKYSPNAFNGSKKTKVSGYPNPKFVSTSYVERQNLTMRMHMTRFTRLTNAFSRKIENHCYAVALHFVYYNFCKIDASLSITPAMQASLTKRVMSVEVCLDQSISFYPPARKKIIPRKNRRASVLYRWVGRFCYISSWCKKASRAFCQWENRGEAIRNYQALRFWYKKIFR